MSGLSGTSSYAVFVYLCICICLFVLETLGNINFDILGPRAFRKCIIFMVYHTVDMSPCGTDKRRQTREDKASQPLDGGGLSFAISQKWRSNKIKAFISC